MAKRTSYVCSECGYEQTGWTGKCPACNTWDSMVEFVWDTTKANKNPSQATRIRKGARVFDEVEVSESKRIDLKIGEINRVLGGGLVKDSVVMLTAKPGAGKSTLLLMIAGKLSKQNIRCLYASGEESSSQIKARGERILQGKMDELYLLSTNSMNEVMEECSRLKPQVLFLDSVQTMALEELSQRQGSPSQTVEVTSCLVDLCKNPDQPMAAFVVGHVTKEDEMAGLRTLEHLVDVVLYLDQTMEEGLRLLRSTKNRFGYTGEVGIFEMEAKGLVEIANPYQMFITKRKFPVAGTALSLQREGSRFIPIEIEALVSKSYAAYPNRIGDSLRRDELNTLISILEEKANIYLEDMHVILRATAGIKIRERAGDLAILVAIASSFFKMPVSDDQMFLAEVGLTGELKKIKELDRRLRELERLGFRKVYLAEASRLEKKYDLEIISCTTLRDVFEKLTFYQA